MKIRTFIFYCIYSSTIIFFVFSGLLLFPFSYRVRYKWVCNWAKFNIFTLEKIIGIDAKIIGIENIPDKNEKVIVLSNHQSAWETLFFQTLFGYQTWLLKRELLWIPIFGWGLSLLKPIAINRSKGIRSIKKLLSDGKEILDEKIWLVIYPEGTRLTYSEKSTRSINDIKTGGLVLAARNDCLVLLIRHNAGKFWPKKAPFKKGTIELEIAKPFKSNNIDEIRTKCADFFYGSNL